MFHSVVFLVKSGRPGSGTGPQALGDRPRRAAACLPMTKAESGHPGCCREGG